MLRVLGVALVLLVGLAPGVGAQPAPIQLSLGEAVRRAAQQNPQVRAAALEVAIARAQLAQAKAAAGPAVSLAGSVSYTGNRPATEFVLPANTLGPGLPPVDVTITLPSQPPALAGLRLALTYPLYTGGRLEAQQAIAEANVRGAEATLARVLLGVVFQTRQAYLGVLLAREGVAAAGRAVAAAQEGVRVAAARVAAGVSPRFDQIQAEVGLAQAQQLLVRAQSGLAGATQGLAALVVLPVDGPIEPTDALLPEVAAADVGPLVARALSQRPELTELAARRAVATAAIELARSGARPVVAFTGSVDSGYTFSGSPQTTWTVQLAVTLNLYDGGLTRERIREAELRLEQLQAVEAQARTGIELEVRQAALGLGQAREELRVTAKLLEQAQEALRISRVRFEAGVGISLEVVQAQAVLAQAEQARAQALFNLNLAVAQLERAVGGPVQ